MRRRTTLVSLTVGVLALTGCGGSSTVTTTVARPSVLPPGVRLYHPPHVVPATYTINLASAPGPGREPAGEPNGSGLAVVKIEPSTNQLCWQFAQLKNVTAPTDARLYVYTAGGTGRVGLRLGSTFKASGCFGWEPVWLESVERNPPAYIISIHNARFPAGAVRGRL